jgi:acetyl-CoA carboxylase biotin carboxyl carrier protein
MADEQSSDNEVFEVDRIRELIKLMDEFDLSEIDLRHTDRRIKLRKGGDTPVYHSHPQMLAPSPPNLSSTHSAGQQTASGAEPPKEEGNFEYILSPMVGTFYTKPKPDAENFVKVGDSVSSEETVCLIEAMKMFNEIPAGIAGRIVEVLVKNEEPVDVNKRLFKVAIG